VPLTLLTRSVRRGVRAVLGAYSRLTVESEGVNERADRRSSPPQSGRVVVPRRESPPGDLDDHEADVGGEDHDDHDRE